MAAQPWRFFVRRGGAVRGSEKDNRPCRADYDARAVRLVHQL